MRRSKMYDNETIISLWKENNVDHIDFEFSCGGDSMNDTTLRIYDKDKKEIQNEILGDYFGSEVYNKVEFYDASDGHYMGEAGNVIIELDEESEDEDDMFIYTKNSQSEWSERYTEDVSLELTDEEVKVLQKVSNINGAYEERININYKDDCILTDEDEVLLENVGERIETAAYEHEHQDADGERQDWHTYTTGEEEEELKIMGNTLVFSVSREYTQWRDE